MDHFRKVIYNTYINYLNSISSNEEIPSESQIASYITDTFFKDIFFTQLAVIKDDELFSNPSIIDPLKTFLKKAFILHMALEVSRLNNPKIDNHYILQQIKELDYLTSNLIIPNVSQKNAANKVNLSTLVPSRRRTRKSRI